MRNLVMAGLAASLALSGIAFADPVLRGATLPDARTVALDATATAFFTVLNSGDTNATNCTVAASSLIGGADLSDYNITSRLYENQAVTGPQNPSFDIPAGGRVDLVVGISSIPNLSFATVASPMFRVDCDGGFSSPAWPQVNQLQVTFRNNAPDIIMIADTVTQDGIAGFNENRTALVAVAAVNIGAAASPASDIDASLANEADIELVARSTDNNSPVHEVFACALEDDGSCQSGFQACAADGQDACVSDSIGDTPQTYAVHYRLPENYGSVLAPNVHRLTAAINDPATSTGASTSVAQGAAETVPVLDATTPLSGQFSVIVRNSGDATGQTVNSGFAAFNEDGSGVLEIFRSIDRGFFIQIVPQYALIQHTAGGQANGTTISQLAFQDTRAGDESRNSDYYLVGGAQFDCSVLNATGGRCSATDGEGEQISGEPELFDAGEAFTMELSPDAALARDAAFAQTQNAYRTLEFDSLSVAGASNTSLIRTDDPPVNDPASGRVYVIDVDGCEISIAVSQSLSSVVIDTFIVPTTTMVAEIRIPADGIRCQAGSALAEIAAESGQLIDGHYVMQAAAISSSATLNGQKASYRFVLTADPDNPQTLSRSFDLVLARPPADG